MPTCSHPTAHPRQRKGAILSRVPQGVKKVSNSMALSLNKYIRKRYKYKGSGIKENDLLCKLCYMTEERRVSKKKTNDANIIDEDTQAPLSYFSWGNYGQSV
ncbi:unnamed protein product [Didymodactylos carnosus]|uniref:Uncharacterized protein n=1 Tax=Didymodactylos carnosus TaxID=1234261 RepID=A0A8S2GT28_9BILA|nr:unnamed protein product [Didymodactylos carnosus]CAF3558132.1 unnamed protein product [Didymodactylos carnosus]